MSTSDPSPAPGLTSPPSPNSSIGLPSGRSIQITSGPQGDRFDIASSAGKIELSITLTDNGPVISIQGAMLEINSSDSVSLKCRDLSIQTESSLNIASQGSVDIHAVGNLKAKALGNADIDAQLINLNCGDRSEYNDAALVPFEFPPPVVAPGAPAPSPTTPHSGCDCH
jgi:hypothetical protein